MRPGLEFGDQGQIRNHAESQREPTPAAVGHRIAQRRRARSGSEHNTATFEHTQDRRHQRCVLEHATKMIGRVSCQEHRTSAGHDSGRLLGRLQTGQHHQRLNLDIQPDAPSSSRRHHVLWSFVGVGSRQHDDAVDAGQHPPVEFVVGDKRATTLQHESSWHMQIVG